MRLWDITHCGQKYDQIWDPVYDYQQLRRGGGLKYSKWKTLDSVQKWSLFCSLWSFTIKCVILEVTVQPSKSQTWEYELIRPPKIAIQGRNGRLVIFGKSIKTQTSARLTPCYYWISVLRRASTYYKIKWKSDRETVRPVRRLCLKLQTLIFLFSLGCALGPPAATRVG